MIRIIFVTSILFVISACNLMPDWMGAEEDEKRLEGKRISVLSHGSSLAADPAQARTAVKIPGSVLNNDWSIQNAKPAANLEFGGKSSSVEVSVGGEPEEGLRLTSTPVVGGGMVYTLDGKGVVSARSQNNIKQEAWRFEIDEGETSSEVIGFSFGKADKVFLGGNISYGSGIVFVTTGRGMVYALDARSGAEKWKREMKIPVRSSPVAHDGKLFLITSDNKLFALSVSDGTTLWNHAGFNETATIYGSPSAVVKGNVVVAPFSSGELHAVSASDGSDIWSDSLTSISGRSSSIIALNDIDATPVIDNGVVYAASHDGVLAAIELSGGKRIWAQDISSIETPWVAGDFLFILTTANELVAINKSNGKIRWVSELPSRGDPLISWGGDKRGEKISWSGPVMAGGKLILSGSHGKAVFVSPENGSVVDSFDIPSNSFLPPVIAGKTLYILSNDANLMAIN